MISEEKNHVVHVITGLGNGGAEAALFRLVTHDNKCRHTVISLTRGGKYSSLLRHAGISVYELGMSPTFPSPVLFVRFVKVLRHERPDVVQTWMYHADLLGGIASKVAGIRSVVWGCHNTILSKDKTKSRTRLVMRLNAVLSHWIPAQIISCSKKGMEVHGAAGFSKRKMKVIPNGYNLSVFRPDTVAGFRARGDLRIDEDVPLFGCVARFDPYKDHASLINAFAKVRNSLPRAKLLLVGNGMTRENDGIMNMVRTAKLEDHIVLAGPRDDIPSIMNAIDINVLSSIAEAFPNVLGEAMACGTPCVTTDVGDCSLIVAETGVVCPAGDPSALAQAMVDLFQRTIAEPQLAEACRMRVLDHYSVEQMAKQYQSAWTNALV